MTMLVPDKQRTISALDDAVGRFTGLLRSVPDPGVPALGVWDVAELANHVSLVFTMHPPIVRGEGSPIRDHREIPQEWRQRVADDPERDLEVLAQRIERALKDLKDAFDEVEWSDSVPWHGTTTSPVWAIGGVLLSEAEMHGRDIADAIGAPWRISSDHARLIADSQLPEMPYFVDPDRAKDLDCVIEVRVRGGTRSFLALSDGDLRVSTDRPNRSIDCHISADPVAWLLVGYGRLSPVRAALTGKIFAWGRRPLLSLRFATIFYKL